MGYFVTGATGFIGRNLVELLLEREGTIYVLVREGSQGPARGAAQPLGRRRGPRRRDRRRPLPAPPRRLRRGPRAARGRGRPPLPPRRDLRHDAPTPRRQRVANVEGTRHMVELAEAVEAGPRPHGQLDRRRRPLQGHLARGHVRGGRRTSTPTPTSAPSTSPRGSSARSARGRGASTGRGSSSATRETGEMDKIDGPYYFFKLIRRIRNVGPAVDADARRRGPRDQHRPGRLRRQGDGPHRPPRRVSTGGPSSLTDPNPHTAGEVIDIFARAAHAPQSSVRVPAVGDRGARSRSLRWRCSTVPARRRGSPIACSPTSASRARCSSTSTTRPTSTRARPRRRSPGTGHQGAAARGLRRQALGLLGAPPRPRPVPRPHAGRSGRAGGAGRDRRARPDRSSSRSPTSCCASGAGCAATSRSRQAVRGRVVMVTGASSGIGKSAALKIADAGGIVLLVARTPEKLEETRDQIEDGGRDRPHPPLRPLRHRRHRPDGRRGARPARPRRRPGQQRRPLDPALDRALLRPLPRLRADDAAQLLRRGAADPASCCRRCASASSGQIINVSSIGVQTNMPRFSAYVASKSALDAFSRCIASEIIDDGVNITTIHMPLVRTPMIAPTKMYDRFPTITPEEAADMICEAIIHKPKRIATPIGHARADPLRDQPEVDRLHPQQRLPPVPRLDARRRARSRSRAHGRARRRSRPTSRPTTSRSPSRT